MLGQDPGVNSSQLQLSQSYTMERVAEALLVRLVRGKLAVIVLRVTFCLPTTRQEAGTAAAVMKLPLQ